MKKKVWIINQYASPVGESTRQIKLSKFLTEQGYDVTVICGSKVHNQDKNLIQGKEKYRFVEFEGVNFLVVKSDNYATNGLKRILATLKFQKNVLKVAKKLDKPDVVISDFGGLFGNKFLKFKTKYNAKFILEILDLWPETFVDLQYLKRNSVITKILYKMEYKTYIKADKVIFSFEGGKDYIVEKKWDLGSGGKVDTDKVFYLNNGIDLDEVLFRRKNSVLEDADLTMQDFKAVYLGSIREANNVKAIVAGAEKLKEQKVGNIKILVYGDGDKKEELEKYCLEKELDNIKFKGRLPIIYAPYVLNQCDVNIFNFEKIPLIRFGISPNKLFMYFASEKPVLSTISPNYDIVKKRDCGLVVDNSGADIAAGLMQIMSMGKDRYNTFCENCKQVAKEFDYKELIKVLVNCIEH